ncbi:hypothetical protein [Roseicella aquatilis]|uniref:Uncharacterized protein n=1 Tax=Roseicella aquatilis TaxID=2527868 RepID=A0A4R4DQ27_9PROT|nr:hypothetical protein [Roseicella aquatilis]TCZ63173.1 hypothetical protein EXY23_10060 [Roseicella aquatilis]
MTPATPAFEAANAGAAATLVAVLDAPEGHDRGSAPDAAALRAAFLGPGGAGRRLVAAEVAGPVRGSVTRHTGHETEFAARGACDRLAGR